MEHTVQEQVRILSRTPDQRLVHFRALSVPERAVVFEQLSAHVQQSLLRQLHTDEIIDLLDQMDMQHVRRVLTCLPDAKRRERIVRRLKGEVKEKMEYFLRFHPKASMSLINFNYLFLAADLTIKEAAELIEEHYEDTGRYPEILAHENGTLIGEVPISLLVRERNSSHLRKCVRPVQTVVYQADVNSVIEILVSTECKKVVVLDHDTSVLGLMYADTVRTLFGNLPAESLYDFAGVDDSERPFDSIGRKVQNRYKWLILNLGTSFVAGSVVLAFQDTLNTLTILAVYIPIIAGMGGNAATQSFAIMVRGLTLGTISFATAAPAIWREFWAGAINGLIIGAIVAVISAVWNGDPLLGLVVAIALVGAHIVAGVTGAFVPLLMKRLGKDPAATSSIFITTATDVFGLIFLLGLATLVLL